jgi:hypothetical protein
MKRIHLFVVAAVLLATASAFTTRLSGPPTSIEGYLPMFPCIDIKECSDNLYHPICKDWDGNQLFGITIIGTVHPCQLVVYEP